MVWGCCQIFRFLTDAVGIPYAELTGRFLSYLTDCMGRCEGFRLNFILTHREEVQNHKVMDIRKHRDVIYKLEYGSGEARFVKPSVVIIMDNY